MDPNVAIVLVAFITAIPGIGAFVLAAIAAARSRENGRQLTTLVPIVAKVEQNTNANTATIKALAEKEGIQIGAERGRAAATAEGIARAEGLKAGQAEPQTPSPAKVTTSPVPGEEIKLEDVDSLKLK